jgi:hypothetical protein
MNPFDRPSTPGKGDSNPDSIYVSVGRSLSMWEYTESHFSRLFSRLITPGEGSPSGRRAYGSIASPNGRREMIDKSSSVFFSFFPNQGLETELKDTLKQYSDAASRRNDIAHGIVLQGVPNAGDGYYLVCNMYTSKRALYGDSQYHYNSEIIESFSFAFNSLAAKVNWLVSEIDAHYYASPEKLRERY